MTVAPLFCLSQTLILRPNANQASKKVYSIRKGTAKSANPTRRLSSPTSSIENVYNELEKKYDWHSELSEGRILIISNGFYGFVDNTGREVIPAIYEGASDFEDGEATIMQNGLFGKINKEGETVIPAEYQEISGPAEGFYTVMSGDKWGYINRHNQQLTDKIYDLAIPFTSGLGIVKQKNRYGAIDRAGNEIIPVVFDNIMVDSIGVPVAVCLHGHQAAIDENRNIDFTELYDEFHPYGELGPENLALVKIDDKYGLIDKKFNEVAAIKYSRIFPFREGLARVKNEDGFNYVTPEGKELLKSPLNSAEDYVGEYALASQNSVPGVVDHKGRFQKVNFTGGIGIIKRNGKLALISPGGVLLNDYLYDEVNPFVEARAIVLRSGNYGFIDMDGFEVVKPIYNKVCDFENGSARVRLHDLWGLVALSGEYLVAPSYRTMEPFIDGLSLVEKSHQFGYIGHDGQERVHAAYDSISHFEKSELARTVKNGKHGLVDKNGHEIVIATYDYLGPYSDSLYAVGLAGKYGYIDKTGKIAVKLKYDETLPFVDGLGAVRKKDKWGAIDPNGKTVIPIKYDPIENLSGETITVYKKGEPTTYNRQGKKL